MPARVVEVDDSGEKAVPRLLRDGVRAKPDPSVGQPGPVPGTKPRLSLQRTGPALFIKSAILSHLSLGWVGFVLGTGQGSRGSS